MTTTQDLINIIRTISYKNWWLKPGTLWSTLG